MRIRTWLAGAIAPALLPAAAAAQSGAPPTTPLVLTVPASARAAALGGAWVAGRDTEVIFSNPAQLVGVRDDFSVTVGHFGPDATMASLSSAYAAGKLSFTLGWGVQGVNFATAQSARPPFSYAALLKPPIGRERHETRDAQSLQAVVGAGVQYKGFKIGSAIKYAADRTDLNFRVWAADAGVAHNLFGGVAAAAIQNLKISDRRPLPGNGLPTQVTAGWSRAKTAGPLDLAFYTQASHRADWTSGAAGLEASYSWIEGMSVTGRVGVRRPEIDGERPVSLGGAFSADRLTVEYALQLFDQGRRAHLVTARWR